MVICGGRSAYGVGPATVSRFRGADWGVSGDGDFVSWWLEVDAGRGFLHPSSPQGDGKSTCRTYALYDTLDTDHPQSRLSSSTHIYRNSHFVFAANYRKYHRDVL